MVMSVHIRKILVLIVFSCLLTSPLLASDPVKVVIEETVIEQKTTFFLYGYAEGVDRWQEVSITLSDKDGKQIELTAEINKFGNWGVEALDIGTLSDGTVSITAMLKMMRENPGTSHQKGGSGYQFPFVCVVEPAFAATIFC